MTWKDEIKKQGFGMTVGELIAKLNSFDKSSLVYIDEHTGDEALAIDSVQERTVVTITDGDLRVRYDPYNTPTDGKKCVVINPV
mgnify:CR=1 FL=1